MQLVHTDIDPEDWQEWEGMSEGAGSGQVGEGEGRQLMEIYVKQQIAN